MEHPGRSSISNQGRSYHKTCKLFQGIIRRKQQSPNDFLKRTDLPTEMWCKIIKYLDSETRAAFRQVNSRAYNMEVATRGFKEGLYVMNDLLASGNEHAQKILSKNKWFRIQLDTMSFIPVETSVPVYDLKSITLQPNSTLHITWNVACAKHGLLECIQHFAPGLVIIYLDNITYRQEVITIDFISKIAVLESPNFGKKIMTKTILMFLHDVAIKQMEIKTTNYFRCKELYNFFTYCITEGLVDEVKPKYVEGEIYEYEKTVKFE